MHWPLTVGNLSHMYRKIWSASILVRNLPNVLTSVNRIGEPDAIDKRRNEDIVISYGNVEVFIDFRRCKPGIMTSNTLIA